MKYAHMFSIILVSTLFAVLPTCAQRDVWTQNHETVANLLQQYADDMQANNLDQADDDLQQALTRVNKMQKRGFDLTASNPVGLNLYEQAQNARELSKSKMNDEIREHLRILMDKLI